jgi:DNA invertase Pin-like site-specific DNA recombinase
MSAEKIGPQHLARKAVLYVRQSSTYQVLHNRESQALQYAMRDRLAQLGWSAIEIVDEDLGRSAAGGTTRTGFERMVAEVCLGKVGVVAAREVSRFARNSRDWQQLVEMCRVVDTLLVDQETVYATARQRSPAARAEGQPQRIRARSPAPTLARGTLREGQARRARRRGPGRLHQGRR